jgi:topoisomerase IA-like protein
MKVLLAYPYEDADGTVHKPDSSLTLPDAEARQLVTDGLARAYEAPAKAPAKSAPAKKVAAKTTASAATPKESTNVR